MKIHKIIHKTFAEGPGCRFCVWVQGCGHRCEGCFARELWDISRGTDCDPADLVREFMSVSDDVCGVTLLGGEPFDQAQELVDLCETARNLGKTVIAFTGYRYGDLKLPAHRALLDAVDLLIDGKFMKSLLDSSRPLVGSSNQRFIYLTERISPQEIAAYKNRFEIRTDKNGNVTFNGMGNIEKLQDYIKNLKV